MGSPKGRASSLASSTDNHARAVGWDMPVSPAKGRRAYAYHAIHYLHILPLMDHIISPTIENVRRSIAERLRRRRLDAGWSQAELSARSGVPLGTLKRFESSGHVSLDTLLRLARPLSALHDFDLLFPEPAYTSLDDVIRATTKTARKRAPRRG